MAKGASRSVLVAPILGAVLLYVFWGAYGVLVGAVVPYLLELMETSVRLAALGWLALVASPIAFIALAHRAAHRTMDRLEAGERRSRRFASARAGMFGWFAMTFSSVASGLLLVALFPPPPEEERIAALVRAATDPRVAMGVHALLWIGVAALLFHVDARGAREE